MTGIVVFAGFTYWATSSSSPVQDWECTVVQNPNASSGGGKVYKDGNCAVLLAGCRQQAQCSYTAKSEDRYELAGLNLSDPAVQERLR